VRLIKTAGDTLVLKVIHVQPPQHLTAVTGITVSVASSAFGLGNGRFPDNLYK